VQSKGICQTWDGIVRAYEVEGNRPLRRAGRRLDDDINPLAQELDI